MRHLLLATTCILAPLAAHAQQLDLSGYKLTFDDQFNSLNAGTPGTSGTKWETSVFYGSLSTGNDGSVNPTPPGQAGSQYAISNGALSMAVSPTSSPYLDTNPSGVPGGFSQQYGYIEASIKQAPGNFWNAFWLMPNAGGWPPEIDILEGNGSDAEFTNHGGDVSTPVKNLNIYNRPDLSTGFHTYALMWTPTTLTWYLDGVAVYSCPTAANENQPMNIILSAYSKGGSGNNAMQVQWVHAYSDNGANPTIAGEPGYVDHDGSSSLGGTAAAPIAAAATVPQAAGAPVPRAAPIAQAVPAAAPGGSCSTGSPVSDNAPADDRRPSRHWWRYHHRHQSANNATSAGNDLPGPCTPPAKTAPGVASTPASPASVMVGSSPDVSAPLTSSPRAMPTTISTDNRGLSLPIITAD